MEPEQTTTAGPEHKSSWNRVTPLSKYLAMALLVIMPFLGGYVGYTFAPEKVVEVERVVIQKELENTGQHFQEINDSREEIRLKYGAFVDVDPSDYLITDQYFETNPIEGQNVPKNVTANSARKISENLSLVEVYSDGDTHFPYAVVLYNEENDEIVRRIEYTIGTMDEWLGPYVRVVLEWDDAYTHSIVLYDYLHDISEVLYTEGDSDVQLADVCELGCTGVLYITTDDTVIFARHEKIEGTTATKFIETMSVPISKQYSAESQWESIRF